MSGIPIIQEPLLDSIVLLFWWMPYIVHCIVTGKLLKFLNLTYSFSGYILLESSFRFIFLVL